MLKKKPEKNKRCQYLVNFIWFGGCRCAGRGDFDQASFDIDSTVCSKSEAKLNREGSCMSDQAMTRFLNGVCREEGLRDDFIYYMDFEDYRSFPDPFPRTTFTVKEIQETLFRYPNPEKPEELFRWDIHGRLLAPAHASIPGVAVVIVHGGAANECEFLFTPDGPEEFPDLTKVAPASARVGVAQHMASLGLTVLTLSLPGHYSHRAWPPIPVRRPEFVIGEIPDDRELNNRLAVYTFRMCLEAIKLVIERHLPTHKLYIWGHSTGGEYFYLMEQYGLKNQLIGGLGFGTGMPARVLKEWHAAMGETEPSEEYKHRRAIAGLSRRTPEGYTKSGYVGPNQPWGPATKWFELEAHRRPMFKPFLQSIEHNAVETLCDDVQRASALPADELFITMRTDLTRLHGKKMLYFVGELDEGHWIEGGEKGLEYRREVFALRRFAEYADQVRLVVIPMLTHYGHVESHNERLANLMVTGLGEYFPRA